MSLDGLEDQLPIAEQEAEPDGESEQLDAPWLM